MVGSWESVWVLLTTSEQSPYLRSAFTEPRETNQALRAENAEYKMEIRRLEQENKALKRKRRD